MTERVRDIRARSTEPDQRPTARRTISVLAYLARVASIPALIAGVAIPINQGTHTGATVTVLVEGAAAAPRLPHLPAGTWLRAHEQYGAFTLELGSVPWWWIRVLSDSRAGLTWLCLGIGALYLWAFLDSVQKDHPFDSRNPRRFRILALLVLVCGIGGPWLESAASAALLSYADLNLPPGLVVSAPGIGIAVSPLLVAAGLLVLAEVFRRGRQMSRDVEGLV
ncbi:Protein of unknown function [Actinopolymorpha cephalotaxi]|uniref:DUF2975 domain-containing protein n=1 Tax=Actinopolymorpha cephalotaxi TaxID=504797 RepID=A0A1I2RCB5_9ACTN|nr:DUF2975 domain-containing protein [Actinopolymorpha cephalotaxi]NYH82361.1 hypothetical protein [Actinopolymorpha cephalotaxi]SFG35446.1 Protein of unknown function [Actinopolymorpha cephalotaxi]